MRGGSQEYGLRPGTVPVPLVVGMGVAAEVAGTEVAIEQQRMWILRDRFEKEILKAIPAATVNGDLDRRLPHNSSITFRGVEAEALMANLPTVALSTGAACESGSLDPSRVLLAIGRTHDDAFCTVRMGLGRFTTAEELQRAAEEIIEAVQLLRTLLA